MRKPKISFLKKIVLSSLALVIALTGLVPFTASTANAASSAALSIVPRKDYSIDPGQTIHDTMVIRNIDSSAPLDLSIRVVDFTYTDDTGTPKLDLAEDAPQTAWSLRPFLSIQDSANIKAGGSTTLNLSITIPDNYKAGSYYSAIVYSSGYDINKGNVGLNASGVTLVFVNIPGKVDENLSLKKLGAYYMPNQTDTTGRYVGLAINEPDSIAYTLTNSGNIAESPTGTITISDMFGNKKEINDINPNRSLALLGQTRTFTTCIAPKTQDVSFQGVSSQSTACGDPHLWPGLYTVSIDAFYGQNGNLTKEVTGTAYFWYLPVWFIIVLLVLLLAIIIAITILVYKVKARINRHKPKKLNKKG